MRERGGMKPYYDRVSDVIREYLGNRYGGDVMEMTTHEVERWLATTTSAGRTSSGRMP